MKKQGRGRERREHGITSRIVTSRSCVLSEYFVLCADGGMIGLGELAYSKTMQFLGIKC